MPAETRRLARLRRLEALRAATRRLRAAEAARAEGELAQIDRLTSRTRAMVQDYARPPAGAADGLALHHCASFARGLLDIATATGAQAAGARALADRKQAELAAAELRRAAVARLIGSNERALARSIQPSATGARRKSGTELE